MTCNMTSLSTEEHWPKFQKIKTIDLPDRYGARIFNHLVNIQTVSSVLKPHKIIVMSFTNTDEQDFQCRISVCKS